MMVSLSLPIPQSPHALVFLMLDVDVETDSQPPPSFFFSLFSFHLCSWLVSSVTVGFCVVV